MANTEKLYYARSGLLEAEARVIAVEGAAAAPSLELDSTIFYPEGGGQPCDLGTIGGCVVTAVEETRGRILHALAGPFAGVVGDRVRLVVEGGRRLDYSQAHSGQHLLSALALRIAGAPTVSAHFGKERCAIDLEVPSMPDEELAEIEAAAEQAIADDHPILGHSCPPEDLSSFPLRRRPPAGEDVVRVVEIEGIDVTACCGLHVASTGKLRLVRIVGTEKYKGMTRLYFVAGARAVADYRKLSGLAEAAARALGSSLAELPEAAARAAERRKVLEYTLASFERERFAAEAAAAPELALASESGSLRLAVRRYADRGASSLMDCAKAFAAAGMTALFASASELTVQALSPAAGARLGERLKACLAEAGGKGGGGGASFRAVFPDAVSLDAFLEAARVELSR